MRRFRVTSNLGFYRIEKRFLFLFWKQVDSGVGFNFPLVFPDKETAVAICSLMESQYVLTHPTTLGWKSVK